MRLVRNLQQKIRNSFGASTTEVNAFLILLPLMIVLMLLFPFYHHLIPSQEKDTFTDRVQLEKFIAALKSSPGEKKEKDTIKNIPIKPFDPNNAEFSTLINAGLDTIIAARIMKYANSGGQFKYKEDLQKIYGLDNYNYKAIAAYIDLPDKPLKTTSRNFKTISSAQNAKPDIPEIKNKELLNFDINESDTSTLVKIWGIGPVLSSRIIRYRDMLGGFVDTVQYKEVYGLKQEVLKQLFASAVIEDGFIPETVNINQADAQQLAKHPYISWKIANAITAYRKQHGRFLTLDQLQRIKLVDQSTFDKMKPYLSL